ncbi:MAG: hypothetical protein ACD_63C00198G0003, partial [uncultured bacterium]
MKFRCRLSVFSPEVFGMPIKNTKIVCTIGPSSNEGNALIAMARAGMDLARLNLAHGDYESHGKIIDMIRDVSKKIKRPIGIEIDLQGPKIRVGEIKDGGILLKEGEKVTFSTDPKIAKKITGDLTKDKIFVQYENLHKDIEKGDRIMLADGAMSAQVLEVEERDIICKVVDGGNLTARKGMNFPDTSISVPTITEKDKNDLRFAIKRDVEWVGLSFVRSDKDIIELRELIERYSHGKKPATKITAKIETHEGLDNFDSILEAADGIVVARGDLGPEVSITAVPEYQKMITEKSLRALKPVIVATQMLYSMTKNPRPTRAEVSDVANAVFDHVDGIYLSDETASGNFPVESVNVAREIILDAERSEYDNVDVPLVDENIDSSRDIAKLSIHAANVAKEVDAKAIV